MAPNLLGSSTLLLTEVTQEPVKCLEAKPLVKPLSQAQAQPEEDEYAWTIVWRNVLGFIYLHIGFLYGFYLIFAHAKLATTVFGKYIN